MVVSVFGFMKEHEVWYPQGCVAPRTRLCTQMWAKIKETLGKLPHEVIHAHATTPSQLALTMVVRMSRCMCQT